MEQRTIQQLLHDPDLQGGDLVVIGPRREEGIGLIEAPRGVEQTLGAPGRMDLSIIWDGEGRNRNAALTITARQLGFTGDILGLVENPLHRQPTILAGATAAYTQRHVLGAALAAREAFELCVHTDGPRWWFYLPSAKGGLSQKRCHVIDLIEQKPEEAAADLMALLSRESVAGGGHLEAATAAHQSQKRKMAAEFLPEAWNKVMSEPNKILVEILSDATEKLCGCKADPGVVEGFIRQHVAQWLLSYTARDREPLQRREDATPLADPPAHPDKSSDIKGKKPEFFADKSINSFSFQGNTFPVKSWEQMLTTLCNHFAATHSQQFEKVLWMYDGQQPCFSRYSDQLRIPEKVRKTNIYVETKLAPEEIEALIHGPALTRLGLQEP